MFLKIPDEINIEITSVVFANEKDFLTDFKQGKYSYGHLYGKRADRHRHDKDYSQKMTNRHSMTNHYFYT